MDKGEALQPISNPSPSHSHVEGSRSRLRTRRFRIWLVLASAILLLVLSAPFAYRGWVLSQVPDIELPYDTRPILNLVVPDEENAWLEFRKAAALVVRMDQSVWEAYETAIDKYSEPVPQVALDWAAKNRVALDVWKKGTEKSDAQYLRAEQYQLNSHGQDVRETTEIREIHRAAVIVTMRLTNEGRVEEAWSLCHAQLKAVDLYRRHGHFEEGLLSHGCFRIARHSLLKWIQSEHVSLVHLRHAQHELMNSLRAKPWVEEMVRLDGSILQRLENAVEAEPEFYLNRMTPLPARVELFIRGEPTIAKRVRKLAITNFLQGCDAPVRSRPTVIGKRKLFNVAIETSHGSLSAAGIEHCERSSIITAAHLLQYPIEDNLLILQLSDQQQLHHELLIAATALEAFKRQNGTYPEKLESLVPEFLAEVPDNTLAPVPAPIVYRRYSEGAELCAENQVWGDDLSIQLGKIPSNGEMPNCDVGDF